MINGSIQEEDIAIVNTYAPKNRSNSEHKTYINRHKGETDNNTVIIGDFSTLLTPMDRSSKQKINKETQVLKDTFEEMDLSDSFRTFHPNAEEYTFFSSAHGTLSRINNTLGHKSNLSKFNKIEIISTIFSDHNAIRLDINYEGKNVKNMNMARLNNMFLNNQHDTEKIKRKQMNKKLSRNK